MRNLKRALSLTLASVMLLGMMVVGAGADYHHAQKHDGSQSQAESPLQVSHSDFLLTKFFGLRGAVFGPEL